MAIEQTLDTLGYSESANFLRAEGSDWTSAPDHAHIFRMAAEQCRLRGVYVLRPSAESCSSIVPITYVCEADDEASADRIHRLVWNQSVAPFILVQTPRFVRLYTGFRYEPPPVAWRGDPVRRGILESTVAFNEVAQRLSGLHARSVDDGRVWHEWGEHITPDTRVNNRLLGDLRALDQCLRGDGLDRTASHALIGKFVYLRYLRDRGILSDRKLDRWGIAPVSVFSHVATLRDFWAVNDKLDEWLNGAVFPLKSTCRSTIRRCHVQRVANVFSGGTAGGQLHLGFRAYDFSFIPIETLSVIYQQFLHAVDDDGGESRGKRAGAYYTPIPLVSFVLSELDEQRPLTEGMAVLDPTCGSGAFLVQCYRRLIERKLRDSGRSKLRPTELRELLKAHIFGVDSDRDACQVAALSLILTLLDYVDPPDLESQPQFKLPDLRNKQIFRSDFFDPDSEWAKAAGDLQFDWIVGNPPWVSLSSEDVPEEYRHVWQWMNDNGEESPVGGNQVAEAFAWKVQRHLREESLVGLVMPAMTLFKKESEQFRRVFFTRNDVWCVANFANLADVLFDGRARRPAATFFYRLASIPATTPDMAADASDDVTRRPILTYAPFVVNQEANRPSKPGRTKETWTIAITSTEMREIPFSEAVSGSMLPWKLAMWGSHRDARLLERMAKRFPAFEKFAKKNEIIAHQGLELRKRPAGDDIAKKVDFLPELAGKQRADFTKLRNCGRIFTFPEKARVRIPRERAYVRKGRGVLPLAVSHPPHIILDAGRRFAVYSDEFMAVPARQIGIAGGLEHTSILKALSVYLNSDFVTYQQFLASPEWGVDSNRATLDALKGLPTPLDALDAKSLDEWATLHQQLVDADGSAGTGLGVSCPDQSERARLLGELNDRVYDLMGLRDAERVLVEDMVNVRMQLIHGKVTKAAVKPPTPEEMRAYLEELVRELDAFVAGESLWHDVTAMRSEAGSIVCVDLREDRREKRGPTILDACSRTAEELADAMENLRQRHSQWVYFHRSLRVYEGHRTYLLKPMERLHWTRTQALLDAGEVIADTLTMGED